MKQFKSPNLIMLDIYPGNQNGLELIPSMKKSFPNASILMITRSDETEYTIDSITWGASGYLMKDLIYTQLPFVIRTLYEE